VGVNIGVADGVGAWNTKDRGRPGLWARLLMHYYALECEECVKLWKVDRTTLHTTGAIPEEDQVDIIQILHRAYLRTAISMERTGGWVGSTTACVGLLQRSTLHIANVYPLSCVDVVG
jgi:protein phosphatase PTC7